MNLASKYLSLFSVLLVVEIMFQLIDKGQAILVWRHVLIALFPPVVVGLGDLFFYFRERRRQKRLEEL